MKLVEVEITLEKRAWECQVWERKKQLLISLGWKMRWR